MTQLSRVAFIGNSLPRRCGIATFTTHLQHAVAAASANIETCIVAMTDEGHAYEYPPIVQFKVREEIVEDYLRAAEFLNTRQFEIACLQHEFGIFGGDSGDHVMTMLSRLKMPIVSTLHTVLSAPTAAQFRALDRIIQVSSTVVVMAEKARDLLRNVYAVPAEKIEVIPHGIPDFPFVEPDRAKVKLGFAGRSVILTFGLLSPNKGIEIMIDAMPSIVEQRADAVYVVLGATHPNLIRQHGEAYRESLLARVQALGLDDHVVFLDQFVDQATLLDFISMSDVYVTPYLNEAQMTSGTLAYSFGLGKAVVSTPFWHARELLTDGLGVLVPFGDPTSIGDEIGRLLNDEFGRNAMRKRAYTSSRAMTWKHTAARYLTAFEVAAKRPGLTVVSRSSQPPSSRTIHAPPEMVISHLLAMCDETGLFQHAVHSLPNRAHGYCVDDNARALLLACALNQPDERPMPEALTACFAAFVQDAWNVDTGRFRNFMSYGRDWLEETGSEDSHGRALWALGECARSDVNHSRRRWAAALFAEALPSAEGFRSPRAWAFTLLGLNAYCASEADDPFAKHVRKLLADRLLSIMSSVKTKDWIWFEDGLAYDNARLSQALIVTGISTGSLVFVKAGLQSLRWLVAMQTSPAGLFRPVGTHGFGEKRTQPSAFDQQPLEATATIAACFAAWRADGDAEWKAKALCAFEWFLGGNDLSLPLVDADTGGCRDGLHPDRPNENRGGESAVSYLLGLAEIRQLARLSEGRARFVPRLA